MGKIIMHIDLNAFFAACEELRHPELRGLPLAIGGEGRSGIVSTANYVARKYCVHRGQPTFKSRALCKNLTALLPDFDYSRILSRSFFGIVKEVSPLVEMASIDEAYVDMTGPLSRQKEPLAFLRNLQFHLKKETGLSCSIGIGRSKWVAKMASDMKKPMGLVIIKNSDIPSMIYPLPIESFWGIGKKTAPELRSWGITTIGDLAEALQRNDPTIVKALGKFASVAMLWLQGKGSDEVTPEYPDPKSIGMSETLMNDITTPEEAVVSFKRIVSSVLGKAASQRKVGRTISVVVKDSSFHSHQKSATLERPSYKENEIYPRALALYQALFAQLEGKEIRLIGFTLSRLEDEAKQTIQMNFWNYSEYEEMDATKLLIEELNRKAEGSPFLRAREVKKDDGNH